MLGRIKTHIGRTLDRLFPRLWLAIRIMREDRHFEPEFWLTPLLVDRASLAIDVGANMGEFTYYMARHAGRVIAFEPNLDLHTAIRARMSRNVELHDIALSREPGSVAFRVNPENTGIATIEPRNTLESSGAVFQTRYVKMRTLDSYNFEHVAIIKIDVEGHEEAVLEGARDTLRRNRPVLVVESEDRHNPGAPARLAQMLTDFGYRGFVLSHGVLTPQAVTGAATHYNYVYLPLERIDAVVGKVRGIMPRHLRQ